MQEGVTTTLCSVLESRKAGNRTEQLASLDVVQASMITAGHSKSSSFSANSFTSLNNMTSLPNLEPEREVSRRPACASNWKLKQPSQRRALSGLSGKTAAAAAAAASRLSLVSWCQARRFEAKVWIFAVNSRHRTCGTGRN